MIITIWFLIEMVGLFIVLLQLQEIFGLWLEKKEKIIIEADKIVIFILWLLYLCNASTGFILTLKIFKIN